MKPENRKCRNCGNYTAYYSRGFCYFNNEKIGRCNKTAELTKNNHYCELWKSDDLRRRFRRGVSIKVLKEACVNIQTIAQILSEDCDNFKD